jgi:hypothetical protein
MPDWFQLSGCAGTEADGARARANAAITLINAVKMKSFISITFPCGICRPTNVTFILLVPARRDNDLVKKW